MSVPSPSSPEAIAPSHAQTPVQKSAQNPAPSHPPHLAIALGDPAGIGPEVVLKALATPNLPETCRITLVGSGDILERTQQQLQQQGHAVPDLSRFIHLEVPLAGPITLGQENAHSGASSFASLNRAIDLALETDSTQRADAVVTAPIAKSAWKAAGHVYPGQTELLAERAGVNDFGMIFLGRSPHTQWTLRALLATTHIPLRRVPQALTPEVMDQKLGLLLRFLQGRCGIEHPKVAIAGLNPHSGEQGQLGTEEQDWLLDWLQSAQHRFPNAQIDGLIPPDTLWVHPGQAWYGSQGAAPPSTHDAYLALYHDQGLIPVKLMAFDRAVNTTIGLPFVRTSPDHGTAFDIAGQGIARETSMVAAIEWARQLVIQDVGTP